MNGKQAKRMRKVAAKTGREPKVVKEWWKRLSRPEKERARRELSEHLGIR